MQPSSVRSAPDAAWPTPSPSAAQHGQMRSAPPARYTSNISIFTTVTSWHGTVLPLVLHLPSFYIFVGSHMVFWYLIEYADYFNLPPSWSLFSGAWSLLVFFLVFYGNQCYTRFFQMYGHCVGIGGATMQWVALVKLHLPQRPDLQWNAVRFILAASHVEYYSLSGGELTDQEWMIITGRDLLTKDEIDNIKAFKG